MIIPIKFLQKFFKKFHSQFSNVFNVLYMIDNSNSRNQSSISEKKDENLDISFKSFEFKDLNSQDQNNSQKKIKIVPKKGSSIAELRHSLNHALQVLDEMQANRNLNISLTDNSSNKEQNCIAKPEQFSKQKAYKIFRKKKFIPYGKKFENSKIFNNLRFLNGDIDLSSDEYKNNVDLDQIARSLGFRLEISDQSEEGEEIETKTVDVSEFISRDSQGRRLQLGDRMNLLEQLITIAEGDLNSLDKIHQKERSIIIDERTPSYE